MAEITHEIKINAPLDKTFKALSTLNGLKSWHTADIEGNLSPNEVLTFKGEGKPVFRWKIIKIEPNKELVWECIEGPGDSIGTETIYTLSKTSDNCTLVEMSHTSWPDQGGNFRKCNTLWGILLYHLKKYVETNHPEPAIK